MTSARFLAALFISLLVLPACDSAEEEDVRTIGGTYAGQTNFGLYSVIIPVGTESDPNATFTGTQTEDDGSFTYTGTYDHPSLRLDFGGGDIVPCTVSDDTESMDCTIVGTRYTLERQ